MRTRIIDDPSELTRSERRTSDRRLLQLAQLLRALPRGRFYFGHWVGPDWSGDADLSCGTTACALGWATTIPSLRRSGLRLEKDAYMGNTVKMYFNDHAVAGEDAGALAFLVTRREANFLFIPDVPYGGKNSPYSGSTAKAVARHIEQFVRNRDKLWQSRDLWRAA